MASAAPAKSWNKGKISGVFRPCREKFGSETDCVVTVLFISQLLINHDLMENSFLDLPHASLDIITLVLASMPIRDRFKCAVVCKAWAEVATAATDSIILKHSKRDLSGLQTWLEKHSNQVTVLQLHECEGAALTALPCCAKLQDLLLHGSWGSMVTITSRVWGDLASATTLTSITLIQVEPASQQADLVAAVTALPNLEQLTWQFVHCSDELQLFHSSLLQQATRLTSLDLVPVTAEALQHLGSLTKLQHLSISVAEGWAAAGCPGLQELKALTSLKLGSDDLDDLPASISHLTALQQLDVPMATPTALNELQALTGLTRLRVWQVTGLSPESPPLELPGLQDLELKGGFGVDVTMPMSFLASCTHLQVVKLHWFVLKGPGSLVASTMLQHLELDYCTLAAADSAADPDSWQLVFPSPGQLPHLTSLRLSKNSPLLQQADIERVVACCSNLRALDLSTQANFAPAPAGRLPDLTLLHLNRIAEEEYGALAQLTGLRQLVITDPNNISAVELRQLAALDQLTTLGFDILYKSEVKALADHLMQDNLPGYRYAIVNKVCV